MKIARKILVALGFVTLASSGMLLASGNQKGKPLNCSVTDKKGKTKEIHAKDMANCEGKHHGKWIESAAVATPTEAPAAVPAPSSPAAEPTPSTAPATGTPESHK